MINKWHDRVFENGVVNDPMPLMIDELMQLREIYQHARQMVLSDNEDEFERAYISLFLAVMKHE